MNKRKLIVLMTNNMPVWLQSDAERLYFDEIIKTSMIPNVPMPTDFITVSQVAQQMGVHLSHDDLITVKQIVKSMYKELYGTDPPKYTQWVGGEGITAYSYMERDRQLVLDALDENDNL